MSQPRFYYHARDGHWIFRIAAGHQVALPEPLRWPVYSMSPNGSRRFGRISVRRDILGGSSSRWPLPHPWLRVVCLPELGGVARRAFGKARVRVSQVRMVHAWCEALRRDEGSRDPSSTLPNIRRRIASRRDRPLPSTPHHRGPASSRLGILALGRPSLLVTRRAHHAVSDASSSRSSHSSGRCLSSRDRRPHPSSRRGPRAHGARAPLSQVWVGNPRERPFLQSLRVSTPRIATAGREPARAPPAVTGAKPLAPRFANLLEGGFGM